MDIYPNEETIKEILEEDQIEIKKWEKKKSCLVRGLFFIIVLAVLFFGFIYVQQYLLDIEAEAIVSAARTTTASVNEPSAKNDSDSTEEQSHAENPVEQPTPIPDPAFFHTATIAAQLTSVAEFQKSVTSVP